MTSCVQEEDVVQPTLNGLDLCSWASRYLLRVLQAALLRRKCANLKGLINWIFIIILIILID